MATFANVKTKAEKNNAFMAQLVANPKKALSDANLNLTDPADVARVELFVKMAQEHIRAAGKMVGIKSRNAEWGIGMDCCNGKLLMPGNLKSPRHR